MKKIFLLISLVSASAFSASEISEPPLRDRHTSYALGITNDTEPPYDIFKDIAKNTDGYRNFAAIFLSFAAGNNLRDTVGIRYLGKFYAHYCPEPASEHFRKLSLMGQTAVKELFRFPQAIFQEAKKSVACSYSN